MSSGQLSRIVGQLRAAVPWPNADGLTDELLLETFLARREESAFEALVRRHGPMVLGVCRRVLRNEADAEDAFQATFLVLLVFHLRQLPARGAPFGQAGQGLQGPGPDPGRRRQRGRDAGGRS